jgi:hypothetical protein
MFVYLQYNLSPAEVYLQYNLSLAEVYLRYELSFSTFFFQEVCFMIQFSVGAHLPD